MAKADELGDVAKLNGTVRNGNGHPTSTVDAINNLDNRVETKVGDNTYSRVKGKEIDDGDSATTAIGKLNNRMNDIYTTAGQHSTVSTADANLTLSEGKNASGGTDYKLGLNKENINLGNVTINGNAGSIKAVSFTAGDTVVNKDGVKVGDKSALTGDSLKVGGKTYVDDKGVDANGQAIRNVGDGKNDGDAVNVKQVNDLAARQGEAIGQNAAHINQLDRAVNRLDSRINRVGAGAAALAALHPGEYNPDDKVDFAAGFGNYRGASAAAVGMYYHPDETTTMSVGASFGGGENMVNAGISFKFGQGNHVSNSRVAMAKEIKDLRKEVEDLRSALVDVAAGKQLDPAKTKLFPDMPKNHWAYKKISELAGNGLLDGYPDGEFKGDRMMTRYEFATIVYRQMMAGRELSDRLVQEFEPELERIRIDVVARHKDGTPSIERVRVNKPADANRK